MAKAKTTNKKEEMVTIVVTRPKTITGDDETVVGVNGKMYQIQYDVPVTVPKNVAEIIQQSKDMQVKIELETEKSRNRPNKAAIAEL